MLGDTVPTSGPLVGYVVPGDGLLEGARQHAPGAADHGAAGALGSRLRDQPRRNHEAGFTLIEVLIGVTLLAMLAMLIASGTRIARACRNSAERQSAEIDDMDAVEALLRRTIARARPSFAGADPADVTVAFSGETDALDLVSAQPGTQDHGPWMRERLFVARSGSTRALFMSWQSAGSTPVSEAKVLDRVAAVRLRLFRSAAPGRSSGLARSMDRSRPLARTGAGGSRT